MTDIQDFQLQIVMWDLEAFFTPEHTYCHVACWHVRQLAGLGGVGHTATTQSRENVLAAETAAK